jgi:hypothetical protein
MAPAARDVSISIGDITIHLTADDPRLTPPVDGVFHQFVTDRRRADIEIRAHWTDTPDEPGGALMFDGGPPWQLYRRGDKLVFTFRSELGGQFPYKTAHFDPAFTTGEVRLFRPHFDVRPDEMINPLEYPLDELLMIHVLSQGKGVEVHGCALVDDTGRAYVFPGQSGAGKSTMARLWMNAAPGALVGADLARPALVAADLARPSITLLSDERIVLRTDRDPIEVFGTPWHGDALLASPASGRLAGVFFLQHAPANSITPMTGAAALAKLFSCSFLPFHGAASLNQTAGALERVVSQTPCYALAFVPDASVIAALAPFTFDS